MMRNRYLKQLIGAAVALLISGGVFSAPPTPAGVIAFSPIYLKESAGAKLAQAMFSYQGQTYEVTLDGLGVGGAVAINVTVTGEVYGLNNVADLAGIFVTELADDPAPAASSEDLWLFKDGGVSIRLQTDNPEVAIAPGGDAVTVRFGSGE